MDFGHSNHAGVGKGHWRVAIFSEQFSHGVDMLVDPEADAQRAVLQKLE